ncbi:PaaI family thioesterase [Desulforamulus ruminis]|uniref:PaaI family thioesterase n=1 Tax=Desulforamulus ruminis TaxID=1564 RepID=UPI0023535006|nr:PaaI family thioesterase [Desulforamulus ruminis]
MQQEKQRIMDFANNNPFARMLNIEIKEMEPGAAVIEVKVRPMHLNPHGTLHGGVLSSMADIAMGVAVRTLGKIGVTVTLNTNFINPGNLGERIVARGKVTHQGNTLVATECIITRDSQVLAQSTGVFFVIHNRHLED